MRPASFLRSLPLLVSTAAIVAPSAAADGREPGSVLVHPYHEAGLVLPDVDEEGEGGDLVQLPVGGMGPIQAVFNVVSVTNTNRTAATDVHFQYVNVSASPNPFLFADCTIADRVETLTPADTLSVLTSCHNSAFNASGYLVISAMDPNQVDTYWAFDHLVGSSQLVTAAGGMYSLNAIPFTSPQAEFADTDLDGDGRRDFDGVEYEGIADELYMDSFIGALSGDLVLASLLGGEYLVNVDFVIYNDDEFQLSAQYSFACWTKVPLSTISGFFTNQGLATTVNDDRELDLDCDGVADIETGWAIVRPTTAVSPTSANIANPAVLGAVTNASTPWNNGRLLWESVAKQTNGAFPAAN